MDPRSARAAARRRLGLARVPWLTSAVFALTAAVDLAQLAVPGLLSLLERRPAGLHGEPWRTVTALFVQDGGALGAASNLAFLALVGALAEQVLSRPRWLVHYFGVGLLAELIAYAWQPVGAGNSIAICGLAGAVASSTWRGDRRLPGYAPQALLVWCGALLATLYPPLLILGVLAAGLARRRQERREPVDRPAALAVAATGIALTVATNIHGPALLAGAVLASWAAMPADSPRKTP